MSHTITETEVFPENVPVPDGEDNRGLAAEDVEGAVTPVANRTRWLRAFIETVRDAAAKLGSTNAFTGYNVFKGETLLEGHSYINQVDFSDLLYVNPSDANRALLGTNKTAGDHFADGVARTDNLWRKAFDFRLGGGQYSRVYAGRGENTIAIVSNASWVIAEQRWQHRDPTRPASAIILRFDSTLLATQPAGDASTRWAEWSPGGLNAAAINAVAGAFSGPINASDFLYAGDANARRRKPRIGLRSFGLSSTLALQSGGYIEHTGGGAGTATATLRAPVGAVLEQVELMLAAGSVNAVTATVTKTSCNEAAWSAPSTPTQQNISSRNNTETGLKVLTVPVANYQFSADDVVELVVSLSSGSRIWAARFVALTPGPRSSIE